MENINDKQLVDISTQEKKRPSNEIQLISNADIVPVRKKPKKTPMDEDSYLETVQTIIQKDFFPDLPKLSNQLEWLEAEERKDFAKMREIQMKLRKTGRVHTVRETPGAFETPATFTPANLPADTPGAVIRGSNISSNPLAPPTEDEKTIDGKKPISDIHLDEFQAKHTSEDNDSFESLIDRQNTIRKQHYSWLHERETESKLLITGPEVSAGAIQTWKYTAKNQLMYHPVGAALTEKEDKIINAGPPKEISRPNTRLHGPTFKETKKDEKLDKVYSLLQDDKMLLQQRRAMKDGRVDLDELRGYKKKYNRITTCWGIWIPTYTISCSWSGCISFHNMGKCGRNTIPIGSIRYSR